MQGPLSSTVMIYSLIILLGIFTLSIQQITNPPDCASPLGYDIRNLTKPKFWTFDRDGECVNDLFITDKCSFLFSFCHSLQDITKCVNSSVCQASLDRPEEIYELGEFVYDPFTPKEVNGFYAVFGTGQNITNKYTNESCHVTMTMEFDCDSTVEWSTDSITGVAPAPLEFSGISETSCNYFVKFPYAGACYRIQTTTPFNPPPSNLCIPPSNSYNISSLTQRPYWIFNIEKGCDFLAGQREQCSIYAAFCKPFESLPVCNGTSACLLYPNSPQQTLVIGNYTKNPFAPGEANGFNSIYPPGSEIINPYTNKSCPISLKITFECDSLISWDDADESEPGIAPAIISFSTITSASCELHIVVPYSGACTKPQTTTPFNPPPAKLCIPPSKGYDISSLTLRPYWIFNINEGCDFLNGQTGKCSIYAAFCKPFESLPVCNGSSACLLYPNKPQQTLVIGNYTVDPFVSAEANGFDSIYPAGSEIINPYTNKSCPISLKITFDCDPLIVWDDGDETEPGIAPDIVSFSTITDKSCELHIIVPYSGACINIGPSKPTGGLSTGTILLCLFVVFIFLYIVIGFTYNSVADKQRGVQALPHYEFWLLSATNTKDGFVYVFKKLTCQNSNELVYNSI